MYNSGNLKHNKRKNKIYTTLLPLILFLVLGGIVGKTFLDKKVENENSLYLGNNLNEQQNILNDESNNILNEIIDNENKNNNVKNDIENETTDEGNSNIINDTESQENEKESNNENSNNTKNINDSSVAFIGDSRTQGFVMYNGLTKVQDYSYVGLMVDTAISKKFVKTNNGEKITLLDDMKNKNINSVYIMLGLNELGWSYPQVFKVKYEELIDEIRAIKPNCKIYVQSIIPVTKSKDEKDKIFNNSNVQKFNKLIKEVAEEKNVKYLDVGSALVDSNGYLPEQSSPDGIHISKKYCEKWLEYLKNNS